MPQCEVFWPFQSNFEVLGVPEDSQVPISGVWVSSSHFPQSKVTTFSFHNSKLIKNYDTLSIAPLIIRVCFVVKGLVAINSCNPQLL
jgi:hypothetical protein